MDVWHFHSCQTVFRGGCAVLLTSLWWQLQLLPSLFGVLSFCGEDSVSLVVGGRQVTNSLSFCGLTVFESWCWKVFFFFLCLNLLCTGFLFIKICFHCPMTYPGFTRNLPSSVLLFIYWQDLQIANPTAPFVIILSPPSLLCLFDIWNTVTVAVLSSLSADYNMSVWGWFWLVFLMSPIFFSFYASNVWVLYMWILLGWVLDIYFLNIL